MSQKCCSWDIFLESVLDVDFQATDPSGYSDSTDITVLENNKGNEPKETVIVAEWELSVLLSFVFSANTSIKVFAWILLVILSHTCLQSSWCCNILNHYMSDFLNKIMFYAKKWV